MQLNVKTLRLYFFLLFFLRGSLAGSVELFHYYNLIFLYFQFSAVRPDHLSQVYFQKTVHKIHPTTDHPIGVQIRLTNPNTTPDNQTRPPNQTTIRSDRHGHTRLQDQMSPPDYCPWPTQLQISTVHQAPEYTQPPEMVQVWCIPCGMGKRGVYRFLDEPCKAYYSHTFGLKHPDVLFGLT